MIERRARIVLRLDQCLQGCLLAGGGLEGEQDAVQPGISAYRPLVKLRPRQRMDIAIQGHSLSFVEAANELSGTLRRRRCGRHSEDQKDTCD
jgi:hypothetical protein